MKSDGRGGWIEEMLNHEEFLQRYVLNRARAHVGGLQPDCLAYGERIWQNMRKIIDEEMREQGPTPARETDQIK